MKNNTQKNLSIISLNVRGMINTAKRRKILIWLKRQNVDIAFLQETHCTKSRTNCFKNSWSGLSYYGNTPSPHSKGVGILFKQNLNVEVHNICDDESGRCLLLNVDIESKLFTLVNIYAPNDSNERGEFFKHVDQYINKNAHNMSDVVMAGDFNCCINYNDRSTHTHIADGSRVHLKNCILANNLFDVWTKYSNPTDNHYTWSDKVTSSRLDYCFLSMNTSLNVKNIKLQTVITDQIGKRITDHKAIVMDCSITVPPRGPGYWKLNNSHLTDNEYCEGIKEIISKSSNDTTLSDLSKSIKWDILKKRIKEYSIKFGIKKAKQRKDEIKKLEDEMSSLNNLSNICDTDVLKKESIQNRLYNMYSEISYGAQIRAKVDEISEVESNRKLFKNIEKARQTKNVIEKLKIGKNQEITNQDEILHEIGQFYSKLYTSQGKQGRDIKSFLNKINFNAKLSNIQKQELEETPTLDEITKILPKLKENKSPGLDGLSIEFYKKFWNELDILYFEMVKESWELEILPLSMRTSVLSTIHKGNERIYLKNYRPLSLSNCDYKIMAFVFSERLQLVISAIIHTDQVACIKNRYIGTNIRNLLDLYEYCEENNKPGAFLCADFEKAYDSIERDFLWEVLRKFNFGEHFIKWIQTMYAEPIFVVKNNSWLSRKYKMERGLRQGDPLSALLFIIVAEILSNMIRNEKDIKGILVGENEHKIVQYADDVTFCVRDVKSIDKVVQTLEHFGIFSGLTLNVTKTKGIWLGELKDYGLRVHCNIQWTGNPIKVLGIYIGHNKIKCAKLNWESKVDKITSVLQNWNKRKISLFGKVEVIKLYALSKIVYQASVMAFPESELKRLKHVIFYYLWGRKDNVKRSTVINSKQDGGLSMIDIDKFLDSLKAVWIDRLFNIPGKWKDILRNSLEYIGITLDMLIKTSFMTNRSFPVIAQIPSFYQNVIVAFNKAKGVKQFERLTVHEKLQLPIWGCEYFKVNNTCLYFKGWIKEGIIYVKDLINENGEIKNDTELYKCNRVKHDILKEVYVIKRYVIKRFKHVDVNIAPYIKIKPLTHIIFENKLVQLKGIKSKIFYNMFTKKQKRRGHMETIYSREFNFDNLQHLWENIYLQKVCNLYIPKLCEFNFKILHNFLPCGLSLSKWKNISQYCCVCGEIENIKHMLYECQRIKDLWGKFSVILDLEIKWKHIVCGFPKYSDSMIIRRYNLIITIIAYAIFKENSLCKFQELDYRNTNFGLKVKENVLYYEHIMKKAGNEDICNNVKFKQFIDNVTHLC